MGTMKEKETPKIMDRRFKKTHGKKQIITRETESWHFKVLIKGVETTSIEQSVLPVT